MLKIVSYFTVILPLVFGVAYGVASLCGRCSIKTTPRPKDDRVAYIATTVFSPSLHPQSKDPRAPEFAPIRAESEKVRILYQNFKDLFITADTAVMSCDMAIANKHLGTLKNIASETTTAIAAAKGPLITMGAYPEVASMELALSDMEGFITSLANGIRDYSRIR